MTNSCLEDANTHACGCQGARPSLQGASVKCSTITAPGVVLLGDAAHGVRPTMGQVLPWSGLSYLHVNIVCECDMGSGTWNCQSWLLIGPGLKHRLCRGHMHVRDRLHLPTASGTVNPSRKPKQLGGHLVQGANSALESAYILSEVCIRSVKWCMHQATGATYTRQQCSNAYF